MQNGRVFGSPSIFFILSRIKLVKAVRVSTVLSIRTSYFRVTKPLGLDFAREENER